MMFETINPFTVWHFRVWGYFTEVLTLTIIHDLMN